MVMKKFKLKNVSREILSREQLKNVIGGGGYGGGCSPTGCPTPVPGVYSPCFSDGGALDCYCIVNGSKFTC